MMVTVYTYTDCPVPVAQLGLFQAQTLRLCIPPGTLAGTAVAASGQASVKLTPTPGPVQGGRGNAIIDVAANQVS